MTFEIPERARRELEEQGWDGVTPIEPEDEQPTLPVAVLTVEPTPDADIDAAFGAALPSVDENRIGKFMSEEHRAPETQRLSAIDAYAKSGTQRRAVYDLIAAAGDRGKTDEEIADALGFVLNAARPRRNELMNDGWIEDSGTRRLTRAGKDAAVWVLTEAAKRATA